MKRVYLAGPMRGVPEWNFPAFDRAKSRWERAGCHVFCPATQARVMGYAPDVRVEDEPGSSEGDDRLRHVLLAGVLCLTHSHAIAVLSGWERSRGAAVEVSVAQFLGLPIYCASLMVELSVPTRPWLTQLPCQPKGGADVIQPSIQCFICGWIMGLDGALVRDLRIVSHRKHGRITACEICREKSENDLLQGA